jgi:hypothetical protein
MIPAIGLYHIIYLTPKFTLSEGKMSFLQFINDKNHQLNLRSGVGRIQSIYTFAREYARLCLVR